MARAHDFPSGGRTPAEVGDCSRATLSQGTCPVCRAKDGESHRGDRHLAAQNAHAAELMYDPEEDDDG